MGSIVPFINYGFFHCSNKMLKFICYYTTLLSRALFWFQTWGCLTNHHYIVCVRVCLWAKWSTRWQSFPYKKGLESQNEFNTAGSFWAAATVPLEVQWLKSTWHSLYKLVFIDSLPLFQNVSSFAPAFAPFLPHEVLQHRLRNCSSFLWLGTFRHRSREDFWEAVFVGGALSEFPSAPVSHTLLGCVFLNGTRLFQHPTPNLFLHLGGIFGAEFPQNQNPELRSGEIQNTWDFFLGVFRVT